MNDFAARHIGITQKDAKKMLKTIGMNSVNEVISNSIPKSILSGNKMELENGITENEVLNIAKKLSSQNKLNLNFIGQGYHGTLTPSVIKRNILENPSWYTAYTPYQAEISQGRLEMLLNFQQMIIDITGLDIANSSLLDEATATAEALLLAKRANNKNKSSCCLVDENIHPQTLSILQTRTKPLNIKLVICDVFSADLKDCFAIITQPLGTHGKLVDYSKVIKNAKENNIIGIVICDILATSLFKTPAEMGADIAIGSTQRFGVPMGFGGPHAAFIATIDKFKRLIPGRIIGVSKDAAGKSAMRMAMQTREQHIRRDKATSNICTAQVLLAIMAVSFAIYHGRDGIINIAKSINNKTKNLAKTLKDTGYKLLSEDIFDAITLIVDDAQDLYQKALNSEINLRVTNNDKLTINLDETTTYSDILKLLKVFGIDSLVENDAEINPSNLRKSDFLTHQVFNNYHSETAMMRYLKSLEDKDIALNHSMIALGSCTMKLNAATEMMTIGNEGFANLHPFAPQNQTTGYLSLIKELEQNLATITGYDAISLQPNAGSQGEFAGLLAIKNYHQSLGQNQRNICLIPASAHGTNPASAVMAGMRVKIVKCLENGDVDITDLRKKSAEFSKNLAAIMITYPSTHGVFEEGIKQICDIIHQYGGQVYLDGANLNAMVGLTRIGDFGADVSHLNLHKTFAIPHGGGGPGVGPIGVKQHLIEFLPGNPLEFNSGAVSAANYGSASILPISWSYIKLLGKDGLEYSTITAIFSANYIAKSLDKYFPVLYTNSAGLVAHECIIDLRELKKISGISEEDISKRLIDYGFHAPTMSFPVAGTLMIEPTESESKVEIDRFITAMISIYNEIQEVIEGTADKNNNVLKNAPHTAIELADEWLYPYSRIKAFYPIESLKNNKYFPPVKRVDNVYGDRNLFCSCINIKDY